MDESNKLPLRRVELSLTKFNEVAIPHHLDLLRQHRANIIKYEQTGELSRVRAEQTNARRVTAQLRSLLRDLEQLRAQVKEQDLISFDNLTQRTRDYTLKAIMDYLESTPISMSGSHHRDEAVTSTTAPVSCSAVSTDSVGLVAHQQDQETEELQNVTQLQIEREPASLSEREAVLRGYDELQSEVRELRDTWQHVHAAARLQRERVLRAATSTDSAADDVQLATRNLAVAERLKSGWYPMAGLVIGGALCGPIGLVVGVKAAAAAALAGSALGYSSVAALVRRREPNTTPSPATIDKDK